jgi:hypothetical protein
VRARGLLSAALFLAAVSSLCPAEAPAPAGSVTVSYEFTWKPRIASNQVAVWIEDAAGAFVRTLIVTNFTGKRAGWKFRAQSLPGWVRAAGVASRPQAEIDAVSGPTPRGGTQNVTWDLRDAGGKPVPAGVYTYRVEASIYREHEVTWSGTIRVGGGVDSSAAVPAWSSPEAERESPPVTSASARYSPRG